MQIKEKRDRQIHIVSALGYNDVPPIFGAMSQSSLSTVMENEKT